MRAMSKAALSVDENLRLWRKIEQAKHHLFYTLIRLGLTLRSRVDDPDSGLVFDFLSDAGGPNPHNDWS